MSDRFAAYWVIAVLFAAGSLFLFVLVRDGPKAIMEFRLAAFGEPAQATVTACEVQEYYGRSRTLQHVHRVAYTFTTPDGRSFDGHDQRTLTEIEPIAEGGPVAITYLASAPQYSVMTRSLQWDEVFWTVVFLSILTAGSLGFLYAGWRGLREVRKSEAG